MNNSTAIWWSIEECNVVLDTNIFISADESKNYLEFGIKIKGIKSQNKDDCVSLYIPYKIKKFNITDKVPILKQNNNLTSAMFNENLSIDTENNNIIVVRYNNKDNESKSDFRYMDLLDNYDIVDEIGGIGTVIKININEDIQSDSYDNIYYRFRINKLEKIFTEIDENYLFVDKFIKKIINLDFNINKNDKLSNSIIQNFNKNNYILSSQNLFLKTDMNMNIIFQSKYHKNIKVLSDIWRDYICLNNKSDNVIVYHWKEKEVFLKLSYVKKSKLLTILMITLSITIFTIGVNYFSNYLFAELYNGSSVTKEKE